MTMDYAKLGFKCGLEIHQQLEGRKLFCHCPARIQDGQHDFEFSRRFSISAGESGTVDVAVREEQAKGKEYFYRGYHDSCCHVEADDEPPHGMDPDALRKTLIASLFLKSTPVDEIHVMRKLVVDGSNVSGFQRTSLVATGGSVKTPEGQVTIQTICLEEESAKIVEKTEQGDVYNLSRLGIPLIEIATGPEIKSPKDVRHTAFAIGSLLRSIPGMKRGLGTIRQDINISIRGGARVEIKGAQDLKSLELLTEREIERQVSLVNLRSELQTKEFAPVTATLPNVSKEFENSSSNIVKGKEVHAFFVENFANMFKRKISGERTLGNEIANYARVKAGIRGFIHSDEDLEKYGLSKEFVLLRQFLGAKETDLVIIIAAPESVAKRAAEAIVQRINLLAREVPEETRKALPDGTSEYMRPLPGASRMYPETDVPPAHIDRKLLADVKKHLPESAEKKQKRFVKEYGLNKELAGQILESDYVHIFEHIMEKRKDISAKDLVVKLMSFDAFVEKEKLSIDEKRKEHLIGQWFIEQKGDPKHFFDFVKFGKVQASSVAEKDVESFVQDYIEKNKPLLQSKPEANRVNVLMGPMMQTFKGSLDGKVAAEIARKKLKEAGL